MGADEKSETKSKSIQGLDDVFGPAVLEKLDKGWYIVEDASNGQLSLLAPPSYGDAA